MFGVAEIVRAFQGSWALFQRREEGLRAFDLTVEGFWRSFGVAVLLIPPLIITSFAERALLLREVGIEPGQFAEGSFWLLQGSGFIVDWLLTPVVLALLARPFGFSSTYVPFVVVRNWTSLLAVCPYLVPAILYLLGIISGGIMVFLTLLAMLTVLYYRFIVVRMALRTSMGLSIGIVLLDFLLSILIGQGLAQIIGG